MNCDELTQINRNEESKLSDVRKEFNNDKFKNKFQIEHTVNIINWDFTNNPNYWDPENITKIKAFDNTYEFEHLIRTVQTMSKFYVPIIISAKFAPLSQNFEQNKIVNNKLLNKNNIEVKIDTKCL